MRATLEVIYSRNNFKNIAYFIDSLNEDCKIAINIQVIRLMQTLNPYLAPILKELDDYLDCSPKTNEHQIIKHLQEKGVPPFDHFELSHAKDLFNAHFLCMHALYHLKNNYLHSKRYQLIIQSVRVERHIFSTPSTSNNDPTKSYIETADPLANYYLNPKHYFETQENDITEMLKSFWKKYLAQDQKQDALKVLDLPYDADAKAIKDKYKRLAHKHHPDKGGCAEIFNQVREAKKILDQLIH